MQITFNTPYGFAPASTPGETVHATRVLRETVSRLNQLVRHGSGASATLTRAGRCLFTFDLPDLFSTDIATVEDSESLKILLDGLIDLNIGFLRNHRVPKLYDAGVTYGRTDIWDTIPALYAPKFDWPNPRLWGRAYGDCKSLSAALIAQYRVNGHDSLPAFRSIPIPSGVRDYHILVLNLNPVAWEDPSKKLGMGRDENPIM